MIAEKELPEDNPDYEIYYDLRKIERNGPPAFPASVSDKRKMRLSADTRTFPA